MMTRILLLFLCSTSWTFINAVPFRLTIVNRDAECMWEKLATGEAATMSTFLLEGAQLKATMVLEGPFAKPEVEDTNELAEAEHAFAVDELRWTRHTLYKEIIDFEHMQLPPVEEEDDDEDDEEDWEDDDDSAMVQKDTEDIDQMKIRLQERRARRAMARRKIQQARRAKIQAEQERAKLQALKVRQEGEPHQKTIHAEADGWYRGCLYANFNRIVAEIEFRTSKEQGGIDPETQHVYSFARWEEQLAENEMQKMTAEDEPSIKPEDFEPTREKLRDLRKKLNQIQSMQQVQIHTMQNHQELGQHAHSRMKISNFLITILFVGMTLFQVYTIQQWFKNSGSSLLATRYEA